MCILGLRLLSCPDEMDMIRIDYWLTLFSTSLPPVGFSRANIGGRMATNVRGNPPGSILLASL
jgi:hypothetical protein